jgi:hypothetical protein
MLQLTNFLFVIIHKTPLALPQIITFLTIGLLHSSLHLIETFTSFLGRLQSRRFQVELFEAAQLAVIVLLQLEFDFFLEQCSISSQSIAWLRLSTL